MNDLAAASTIAQTIETLGIIGILALISIIFIYLHIKEVRLMQDTLKDINIRIKDLIESQKELNHSSSGSSANTGLCCSAAASTNYYTIGFRFDNKQYSGTDYDSYRVTVSQLEQETGFTFFPSLSDETKGKIVDLYW